MKAVLTLIFVLILGATAQANNESDVKIDSIEMGVVLVAGADVVNVASQVEASTEDGIARLYKFQNSRVKKALTFSTKRSRAKLV